MSKELEIRKIVLSLKPQTGNFQSDCFISYFLLFNRGEYFHAHDVLEHVWLQQTGIKARFFKGLIQYAGAFVHLQKNFYFPNHRVHSRRIYPASRLFRLAKENLSVYPTNYFGVNVSETLKTCELYDQQIREKSFQQNPWNPKRMPWIEPPRAEDFSQLID